MVRHFVSVCVYARTHISKQFFALLYDCVTLIISGMTKCVLICISGIHMAVLNHLHKSSYIIKINKKFLHFLFYFDENNFKLRVSKLSKV